MRRLIAVSGWTLCLTLALYTYLSDILYLIIRRPLTAGLLVAADNLRAIQASAESIITLEPRHRTDDGAHLYGAQSRLSW